MNTAPRVTNRFLAIDVLRGFAIFLMFIYHFSFDLNYFGYIDQDFYTNPAWKFFRIIIVSLFLVLVGFSLHLATRKGIHWLRYFRRLGLLIFYATLVSLGSWYMFPNSMIFFGILHFIAVISVLGLFFTKLYWTNLVAGISILVFSSQFSHPFFNQDAWQWIGFMTHLPVTEDYAPLFPWSGVVLIGIFLGRLVERNVQSLLQWQNNSSLVRLLAFGGRHSIHIYMIHQPLFIGMLYLIKQFLTP